MLIPAKDVDLLGGSGIVAYRLERKQCRKKMLMRNIIAENGLHLDYQACRVVYPYISSCAAKFSGRH